MNLLEHEYLVPVIIGNSKDSFKDAEAIYKATKIKPHLFGEKFSFFQQLRYNCHVVSPFREEFLAESLTSFASSLEEYYCPILVLNSEYNRFFERYLEIIDSTYVKVNIKEILKFGR